MYSHRLKPHGLVTNGCSEFNMDCAESGAHQALEFFDHTCHLMNEIAFFKGTPQNIHDVLLLSFN